MRTTINRLRRVLPLFAILVLSTLPASAQPILVRTVAHAPAEHAATIEEARSIVYQLMLEQNIPGLTVAVMDDGEIIWSEGFGYSDIENRVPVWPHTKMRIGSVSKSLTAAAVGLLVEEGKLDLDAPVQTYVPSFPKKRNPITTRQAAGHLAGIRHYEGDEFLISRRYASVLEGLSIFEDDPLLHEPGTKYLYSSYGWNLVSAVVEGASDQPFLPFMERRVFRRLGMHDTVADYTDSLIVNRPRYYEKDSTGRLLNAPFVDNSYKWAGGGFLSTAEDIVQFGDGLLEGKLLEPETLEMLWRSQKTSDGTETGYGIGFSVGVDEAGRRWVGHGGGSVGGTTQFLIYPEERLVLAIISNLTDVRYDGVHQRISEIFLE